MVLGRVHIDESMLTGESIPVVKNVDDYVYAGTMNGEESFELEVTSTKARFNDLQYYTASG